MFSTQFHRSTKIIFGLRPFQPDCIVQFVDDTIFHFLEVFFFSPFLLSLSFFDAHNLNRDVIFIVAGRSVRTLKPMAPKNKEAMKKWICHSPNGFWCIVSSIVMYAFHDCLLRCYHFVSFSTSLIIRFAATTSSSSLCVSFFRLHFSLLCFAHFRYLFPSSGFSRQQKYQMNENLVFI